MASSVTIPFDVKLMNVTATLVFVGFVLVLLAGAGWWVLRQPFFPLAGIKVDGQIPHINVVTLRATVAPQLAGNFFTVDLARARAAFESVPWVRKAVVKREFPNQLRATLIEHVPVAHWGNEDESRLINGFGEVFDANVDEVDDQLPRLAGPVEQAGQVLGMYRVLHPVFDKHELVIDQLTLTSRGSWRVLLDTGATLELGRGKSEDVAVRTERFLLTVVPVAHLYGRGLDAVEGADLRHNEGYALRMRGVTTVVTDPKKK